MFIRIVTSAIWVLMAVGVLSSAFAGEDGITLKMGFTDSEGHSYVISSRWMAEELKKRTNGRINLELYPSAQLGSEREMYEGAQFDSIDICTVVTTVLSSFIPEMTVLDQPFLFNDDNEAHRIIQGKLGVMIGERMRQQGVHLVGWFESNFRNVYCNRSIDKIEDFKGMKLRVMENPIQIDTWNAIGVIATPMPAGEIFTALQQKTIDGAEGGVVNVLIRRFFEVAPHVINTRHLFTYVAIGLSNAAWNAIPDDLRPIFLEVMKEGTEMQSKMVVKMNEEAAEELKKYGVTFHDQDREAIKARIAPVMEGFKKQMNQEWLTILDEELAAIRNN